jgi:hypothetical protein
MPRMPRKNQVEFFLGVLGLLAALAQEGDSDS